MVNLWLPVFDAVCLLPLFFVELFTSYQSQLCRYGEVSKGQQKYFLYNLFCGMVFGISLLKIFKSHWSYLHRVPNRKVFELLLQNIVPLRPLFRILELLPLPKIIPRNLKNLFVILNNNSIINSRSTLNELIFVLELRSFLVSSLFQRRT
jgi:hypothetical protein